MQGPGLLRYVWSHNALRVIGMWAIGGGITVLMLITPIQVEHLTNLFQNNPAESLGVGDIALPLIIILCIELLVRTCFVLDGILRSKFETDLCRLLIRDTFRRVLRMPHRFFQEHEVERINTRVLDDSIKVVTYVASALVTVPMSVVALLYFGIYMLVQNWVLGLCVLLASLSSAYFVFMDKIIQRRTKRMAESWDSLRVRANEVVSNASEIRLRGAFSWGDRMLNEAVDEFAEAAEHGKQLDCFLITMGKFVRKLQVIIVYGIGSLLCLGIASAFGTTLVLTWGEVIKFAMIAELFSQPVSQLSKFFRDGRSSHQFMARLGKFLTMPVAFNQSTTGREQADASEGTLLEYDGVRLAQTGRRDAGAPISVSIEDHEWVAVFGPAAAGKSAFLRTAICETAPLDGRIVSRGVSLLEIDYEKLTDRFVVVSQSPGFFDFSLRDNILADYMDRSSSEAGQNDTIDRQLVRVVRQVGLVDFVVDKALRRTIPDAPEYSAVRKAVAEVRKSVSTEVRQRFPDAVQLFHRDQFLHSATVGENIFGVGCDLSSPCHESRRDWLAEREDLHRELMRIGSRLGSPGLSFSNRAERTPSLLMFLPTYRKLRLEADTGNVLEADQEETEEKRIDWVLHTDAELASRISESGEFEDLILAARRAFESQEASGDRWELWQGDQFVEDRSLHDNLLGGRIQSESPEVDHVIQRIICEALEGAGILDDVILLGLEFRVGTGGALIPFDERSKVALARGLFGDPELLIVDEAFDAMERTACEQVFERLRSERPELTLMYSTRKPILAKKADRVLSVKNARIDEERSGRTADLGDLKLSAGEAGTDEFPPEEIGEIGVDLLARCPLLAELDRDELEACFLGGRVFHCKAGDALFRKGDAGGEMFVVFTGVIGLTAGDSGSKIVGTFTPGMAIGEFTVLDDGDRSFSAIVQSDATVFAIGRERLNEFLTARPDIAIKMLKALAKRSAELRDQLHDQLK